MAFRLLHSKSKLYSKLLKMLTQQNPTCMIRTLTSWTRRQSDPSRRLAGKRLPPTTSGTKKTRAQQESGKPPRSPRVLTVKRLEQ